MKTRSALCIEHICGSTSTSSRTSTSRMPGRGAAAPACLLRGSAKLPYSVMPPKWRDDEGVNRLRVEYSVLRTPCWYHQSQSMLRLPRPGSLALWAGRRSGFAGPVLLVSVSSFPVHGSPSYDESVLVCCKAIKTTACPRRACAARETEFAQLVQVPTLAGTRAKSIMPVRHRIPTPVDPLIIAVAPALPGTPNYLYSCEDEYGV